MLLKEPSKFGRLFRSSLVNLEITKVTVTYKILQEES